MRCAWATASPESLVCLTAFHVKLDETILGHTSLSVNSACSRRERVQVPAAATVNTSLAGPCSSQRSRLLVVFHTEKQNVSFASSNPAPLLCFAALCHNLLTKNKPGKLHDNLSTAATHIITHQPKRAVSLEPFIKSSRVSSNSTQSMYPCIHKVTDNFPTRCQSRGVSLCSVPRYNESCAVRTCPSTT